MFALSNDSSLYEWPRIECIAQFNSLLCRGVGDLAMFVVELGKPLPRRSMHSIATEQPDYLIARFDRGSVVLAETLDDWIQVAQACGQSFQIFDHLPRVTDAFEVVSSEFKKSK